MAGEPPSSLNGTKRSHDEMASFSAAVGSKTKPCIRFFSMSGCPFGENCHFLHYFDGGMAAAVSEITLFGNPLGRNTVAVSGCHNRVKTRMCMNANSEEGCKFGDKCHFAHSEMELGKPVHGAKHISPSGMAAASSFGRFVSTSISIDASYAGVIIGKGGSNFKRIHHQTDARLTVKDHDLNPRWKSIELEGTLRQIDDASVMVTQLITKYGAAVDDVPQHPTRGPIYSMKTKLCENFANGTCKFGDRCHFAHGVAELRRR